VNVFMYTIRQPLIFEWKQQLVSRGMGGAKHLITGASSGFPNKLVLKKGHSSWWLPFAVWHWHSWGCPLGMWHFSPFNALYKWDKSLHTLYPSVHLPQQFIDTGNPLARWRRLEIAMLHTWVPPREEKSEC
jgi:hypothetical protein